jgi:hypothetical protein
MRRLLIFLAVIAAGLALGGFSDGGNGDRADAATVHATHAKMQTLHGMTKAQHARWLKLGRPKVLIKVVVHNSPALYRVVQGKSAVHLFSCYGPQEETEGMNPLRALAVLEDMAGIGLLACGDPNPWLGENCENRGTWNCCNKQLPSGVIVQVQCLCMFCWWKGRNCWQEW